MIIVKFAQSSFYEHYAAMKYIIAKAPDINLETGQKCMFARDRKDTNFVSVSLHYFRNNKGNDTSLWMLTKENNINKGNGKKSPDQASILAVKGIL